MKFCKNLNQKIRTYRSLRNISQLELELSIGASAGTISRIENGVTNPSKETILKIANVLNLNFLEKADLMGISVTEEELVSYVTSKLQIQSTSKVRLH